MAHGHRPPSAAQPHLTLRDGTGPVRALVHMLQQTRASSLQVSLELLHLERSHIARQTILERLAVESHPSHLADLPSGHFPHSPTITAVYTHTGTQYHRPNKAIHPGARCRGLRRLHIIGWRWNT